MGTCGTIEPWQAGSFKQLARRLFSGNYHMRNSDIITLDLRFNLGQRLLRQVLSKFPFEENIETPLGELHRMLDVHCDQLL